MLCLDEDVRHVGERFRAVFSKPQEQSVVTVLLGSLACEGKRTLSGILSTVGQPPSWSGLSRLFSEAPWVQEALVVIWLEHFRTQMLPLVEAEREPQCIGQPTRRGRSTQPSVTGYGMGDDATMSTPKGRTMEGVGTHHSTTSDQRIIGHSLVQGRSVLPDHRCPLAPQLDRQATVCEVEAVAFQSNIERMETLIRDVEPVASTPTHVVLDRWYGAPGLWHAMRPGERRRFSSGIARSQHPRLATAVCGSIRCLRTASEQAALPAVFQWYADRERDVFITTGLKRKRWLRGPDETTPQGWRWQKLSDSLARYGASSDREATTEKLLAQSSARWDRDGLFGDGKEERGLDHSPLMRASAMLRLWTLAMLASVFLKEEQQRVQVSWQRPVTARLRGCMSRSFRAFTLQRCVLCLPPDAAQLKSAKIA
jgi:hypothetical protein